MQNFENLTEKQVESREIFDGYIMHVFKDTVELPNGKLAPREYMRHVGAVGLFVHADYQGRGVGTTLMETLLDLADHWLMLVRVELEVFADTAPAIRLYEKLGFACVPNATESRHDIIQAVTLGSREAMVAFCKGIQAAAPVDSYVTPEPWAMPGYDSDVIMAAGAFVQGSSIELSADGPIREPYAVYFQGGLTWYHAKLGILMSLQKLVEAGIVTL